MIHPARDIVKSCVLEPEPSLDFSLCNLFYNFFAVFKLNPCNNLLE